MRTLITVVIAALSLNAFGQGIPQLPYNPDENGDGFIGVPDLQALLSQYGLEFNSAVLSEDAQSAIVYMGEMAHPLCTQACENLPGFWNMANMGDLGLVWDEVTNSGITWLNKDHNATTSPPNPYHYFEASNSRHYSTLYPNEDWKCYCATKELPKVEYSICLDNYSNFLDCCDEKVSEGWYPLEVNPRGNINYYIQPFWRWAVE
jgi:hypothetical protein